MQLMDDTSVIHCRQHASRAWHLKPVHGAHGAEENVAENVFHP